MYTIVACFIALFVWLLLTGYERYRLLPPLWRRVFLLGAGGAVAVGIAGIAILVRNNILRPPEWDLLIFWINGQAASRGLNFYDSTLAARLAAPFHPSADFSEVALVRPFLYPPPTIVWFVPLGWFDIHTAAVVWFASQLAFLAAAILILSRTLLGSLSAAGILFTAALSLMIYGTYSNVKTAQTVFLMLLFVSLAFRYRNGFWGGVWLALAILVKPIMAIVLAYPVMLRRWRALAAVAAVLLLACMLSLLAVGPTVFAGYFNIDLSTAPMSQFTEIQNQSLLAWILRITHSPLHFPPVYFILAAILGAAFLWRLGTAGRQNEAAAFALALTFALLMYPGSLRSYTATLILPVLVLYSARTLWPVALAYGLMWFASGDYTMLATVTIGIALAMTMRSIPTAAEART